MAGMRCKTHIHVGVETTYEKDGRRYDGVAHPLANTSVVRKATAPSTSAASRLVAVLQNERTNASGNVGSGILVACSL